MFIGLPTLYGTWLMVVYGGTQHAGLAENVLDHRLNTRTVYMNPVNRYLVLEHGVPRRTPHVPDGSLPQPAEAARAGEIRTSPPPYNGLAAAWREIIPALIRESKTPNYYVHRPLPAPSARAEIAPHRPGARLGCQSRPRGLDRGVRPEPARAGRCAELLEQGGRTYAIYRTAIGQLFATDGLCTHGRTHLAEGFLQGVCIECPKHNGRFDIRDGSVRRPPPRIALKTYPVREKDGKILLSVAS